MSRPLVSGRDLLELDEDAPAVCEVVTRVCNFLAPGQHLNASQKLRILADVVEWLSRAIGASAVEQQVPGWRQDLIASAANLRSQLNVPWESLDADIDTYVRRVNSLPAHRREQCCLKLRDRHEAAIRATELESGVFGPTGAVPSTPSTAGPARAPDRHPPKASEGPMSMGAEEELQSAATGVGVHAATTASAAASALPSPPSSSMVPSEIHPPPTPRRAHASLSSAEQPSGTPATISTALAQSAQSRPLQDAADLLTGDELRALLSDPQLLCDAGRLAGLPVDATPSPESLLVGCVVRRKAAFREPTTPFYAYARIDKLERTGGSRADWHLLLTVLIERPNEMLRRPGSLERETTTLAYVSNRPGDLEDVAFVPRSKLATALASELRRGEYVQRLSEAVSHARLRATESQAERVWYELLRRARLLEHEAEEEHAPLKLIGERSMHKKLFEVVSEHREPLLEALNSFSDSKYGEWLQKLCFIFHGWPVARANVAHQWCVWLLSSEQRITSYPALDEFLDAACALKAEDHFACDDAGRYSLRPVAIRLFFELHRQLALRKKAPPLLDLEGVACECVHARES